MGPVTYADSAYDVRFERGTFRRHITSDVLFGAIQTEIDGFEDPGKLANPESSVSTPLS